MKDNNLSYLGLIIVIGVAIIIGINLLVPAAANVASATTTSSIVNKTVTAGTTLIPVTISGYQEVQGAYTVYNASSGSVIPVTNITVAGTVVSGSKVLQLNVLDEKWNSTNVNVTGTFEPTGYIEQAGGIPLAQLIIIFAALAIVTVAMYPILKEKLFDF